MDLEGSKFRLSSLTKIFSSPDYSVGQRSGTAAGEAGKACEAGEQNQQVRQRAAGGAASGERSERQAWRRRAERAAGELSSNARVLRVCGGVRSVYAGVAVRAKRGLQERRRVERARSWCVRRRARAKRAAGKACDACWRAASGASEARAAEARQRAKRALQARREGMRE